VASMSLSAVSGGTGGWAGWYREYHGHHGSRDLGAQRRKPHPGRGHPAYTSYLFRNPYKCRGSVRDEVIMNRDGRAPAGVGDADLCAYERVRERLTVRYAQRYVICVITIKKLYY
jgi:hypothetical protein